MRRPWEPVKVKVLLGYFIPGMYCIITVWIIYSQILRFSEDRRGISRQNDNIMFINSVLTNLYRRKLLERNVYANGKSYAIQNYEQLMDKIYLPVRHVVALSGIH